MGFTPHALINYQQKNDKFFPSSALWECKYGVEGLNPHANAVARMGHRYKGKNRLPWKTLFTKEPDPECQKDTAPVGKMGTMFHKLENCAKMVWYTK